MLKFLGIVCTLGGMAGVLYSMICEQRECQKRLEQFVLFLQKSRYAMEREKIKLVDYFFQYIEHNLREGETEDEVLKRALEKIIERLSTNTYPYGQMIWEEVFKEEEQNFRFDSETFKIVLRSGIGFFGRSRDENVHFLEKSIEELERQKVGVQKRFAQERKVWIPVGMLVTLMIVILLL